MTKPSLARFTPGPWTYERTGRNTAVLRSSLGGVMAEIRWRGYTDGPPAIACRQSTGELIAAAPELLEALAESQRLFDALAKGYPEIAADTRILRVRKDNAAALAKAKGGA